LPGSIENIHQELYLLEQVILLLMNTSVFGLTVIKVLIISNAQGH